MISMLISMVTKNKLDILEPYLFSSGSISKIKHIIWNVINPL